MRYQIMSRDTVAAEWNDNELEVKNSDLLPLYLKRIQDLESWLMTRAIDGHRANSRLLKKALRLKDKSDVNTVMQVNAATIPDTYWVRPVDSQLTYQDVKFSDDYFASLALKGDYDSFNRAANCKNTRTPELTNREAWYRPWHEYGRLYARRWMRHVEGLYGRRVS